ncbi:MAG: hypothetical protein JWR10_853 [Rubritepida sp.]|nr:hypothetical protein [Rubritepida sp.]
MQKLIADDVVAAIAPAMRERHFLSPQDAAHFLTKMGLKTTRTTLDTWVSRGGGPLFVKWGYRRIYEEGDLLAWAEARCGTPRSSSSSQAARTASGCSRS